MIFFEIIIIILNKKAKFCLLLCVGEACSLILREEHRLNMFENRMLRKIFGSIWDAVTGVEETT
jgi:hypothetical protein